MSLTQKLFSFNGRIRRRDYWLYSIGVGFVFGILINIIIAAMGGAVDPNTGQMNTGVFAAFILYIPALWIGLALQAKRWHDRDKGAIWILINLIPLIGGIWALIECGFLDGTPGPNRFGPSPKGVGGASEAFA